MAPLSQNCSKDYLGQTVYPEGELESESESGPGGTQTVTRGLQTFMELEGSSCWPQG